MAQFHMATEIPDKDSLPLYCAVIGIELHTEFFSFRDGVALRKGVFEVFSSPMLAFAEAKPGSHTPTPWVAVHGGFGFKSRAQLEISDISAFDGLLPSRAAWLVAALFRLRIEAPVRLPVLANMPLVDLPTQRGAWALSFEASPHQLGVFRHICQPIDDKTLEWVSEMLPVAVRLFHDDRFMRALSIFDECIWSGRTDLAVVLMWTAVEILFDLSGAQHKTKMISTALADYVGRDAPDRDQAYGVIRDLYERRGRAVHAGRKIAEDDFIQSFALVRAMFTHVLAQRAIPTRIANLKR